MLWTEVYYWEKKEQRSSMGFYALFIYLLAVAVFCNVSLHKLCIFFDFLLLYSLNCFIVSCSMYLLIVLWCFDFKYTCVVVRSSKHFPGLLGFISLLLLE